MRGWMQAGLVTLLAAGLLALPGCSDDTTSGETGLFLVLDDGAASLISPTDFDSFGLQVVSDGAVRFGVKEPFPDGTAFPQSLKLLAGPVRGTVTIRALLFRGAATVAQGSAEAEVVEGQMRRVGVLLESGVARLCDDADGDGYGSGLGCLGPDCDDSSAAVSPGAEEVCGNDRDDDCDGGADENCPCEAGSRRACGVEYGGVGECRAGTQICNDGLWNPCTGAVGPALEECNARDDDCDGLTDEGFDLTSDPEHCGQCYRTCEADQVCFDSQCREGGCPAGTEACGGRCVDTDTDLLHCGDCNQPCPSGASCVAGVCLCPAGEVVCRNRCVNTDTDPQHCGRCDKVCEGELQCVAGECGCEAGLSVCGTSCVDTDNDPQNCGDCGVPCDPGEVCYAGECGKECPVGKVDCGGSCVDTTSDELHCGECDHACPAGATCEKSHCVCPGGQTECGTECVDTATDDRHCGECDNPCTGGRECRGGKCLCPVGQTDCGVCVDTSTSNEHCGFCDRACLGELTCIAGECDCVGGETACGTECADTTSDNAHCGDCDRPCLGDLTCIDSACGCTGGLIACGTECVDTTSDDAHCGFCDWPCEGELTCIDSICGCTGGLTACGTECVDTTSDPDHCGDCDDPCLTGQTCQNSQCYCENGLVACGDECVDTSSSNAHCGECDKPCLGHTTCILGECGCADSSLTACGEVCVDTDTSNEHCGGCDSPCLGDLSCVLGECECPGGLTECGTSCVDITSTNQHCGGCDRLCDPPHVTSGGCVSSDCTYSQCSVDYYDLNQDAWDGCEYHCAPVSPGAEVCGDGEDNDCDGSRICDGGTVDGDVDDYGSIASGGTDCDDTDATIHPGAKEICGDGIDQDCVGGDLECPTGMVLIPEGDLVMGSDPAEGESDEEPEHTVHLDAFHIDVHEVTNAEYAECVAAGDCTTPASSGSATRGSYYGNATYAEYPVIHVTWFQAKAYCEWRGCRLPSEAEWERAARGPAPSERTYPWGEEAPTCTRTNYGGPDGSTPCVGDTDAVASRPTGATPEGVMDLAGNVYEWCHDWRHEDYYAVSPSDNPLGPDDPDFYYGRVRRGGGWDMQPLYIRAANRAPQEPDLHDNNLGFRCARSHPDSDHDGDGYSPALGDCDDADPDRNPGEPEVCGDGLDQNCDGSVICDGGTVDADGDEYGSEASGGTDCNDNAAAAYPGGTEVCDDLDNDCNGETDEEGAGGCTEYFYDGDGDGYGPTDDFRCLCEAADPYDAPEGGDCADGDPMRNPGVDEICGDGIDQDCNGSDLVCPGEMVSIPAGTYQRGSATGDSDEDPEETVTLEAFFIDAFPVTNEDFAVCVADGGCTPPSSTSSDTRSSYYGNSTYAHYPVIHVSWLQARAYCRWADKRLLSEAEWEAAARGPSAEDRLYAWGDDPPTCERTNFDSSSASACVGDTSAVDAHPSGASPEGVWDLSGNVYEWVYDWYDAEYYGESGNTDNPLGPASGTERVRKGGAFDVSESAIRGANRYYRIPDSGYYNLGIRCGRSPDVVDHDQDGVTPAGGDCDDGDPTSYPTADELCDGIDNDCDDEIDEGCPAPAFGENDTDLTIPDGTAEIVYSDITIDESFTLSSVNVHVMITHSYIGDLWVELRHPDGTTHTLHDHTGEGTDNIDQVFHVDLFDGKGSAGLWRLQMNDDYTGDGGTLTYWSVTLQ